MDPKHRETLRRGAERLGLEASPQQLQLWEDYLDLFSKWNRAFNLSAIRDPAAMVVRHLLDSLAVAPHLGGQRFIDVGTGGGLPGVPLAILYPEREFHLLDSNGKKTRFLFQVKTALGLDNMTIHNQRVESCHPAQLYDAVLSRAFASLEDMVRGCRHLLAPGGRFVAMKGALPESELAACETLCELERVVELEVPGLDEQRHLVVLKPL